MVAHVEKFERDALTLLVADRIPNSVLFDVINKPETIECKFTGAGYYLDLKHQSLAGPRRVFSDVNVEGAFEGRTVGFVAFVDEKILTLECFAYGDDGIPDYIRHSRVNVYAT